MFLLGFGMGMFYGVISGIVLRHILDLYELPQETPYDAVETTYGASDIISTYPQRPTTIHTSYPRNGGESAQD